MYFLLILNLPLEGETPFGRFYLPAPYGADTILKNFVCKIFDDLVFNNSESNRRDNFMEKMITDTEKKMKKTIESISSQLARLRTGKASPTLIENIKVEYYGTSTPINQLASISVPEPRLIVVHPWDKTAVSAVERAIRSSDLGLNPVSDGTVVRIPIPVLSEERRKELVKVAKSIAEDGKIAIRNIRREIIEEIKQKQKDGEIPEDDSYRIQDKIQELTEKFSREIDEIFKNKEEEILTV